MNAVTCPESSGPRLPPGPPVSREEWQLPGCLALAVLALYALMAWTAWRVWF